MHLARSRHVVVLVDFVICWSVFSVFFSSVWWCIVFWVVLLLLPNWLFWISNVNLALTWKRDVERDVPSTKNSSEPLEDVFLMIPSSPPSTLYYYFFFFCFFFFAFLFCFRKKLTSLLVLFYQEVLLPWKRESTRNEDRIEIPLGARSFFMSLAPIPLLNFSETFSGFFFGGWLSKPFSAIRIFFSFFFF